MAGVLLLSGPASAGGDRKGDLGIGFFGGFSFLDEYSPATPDRGMLFGGRLAYSLTDHWIFEPSYQRAFSQTAAGANGTIDSFRGNLLYDFRNPSDYLRPFLTAGFGVEWTQFGTAIDEQSIAPNVGAGLKWFVIDGGGFRVDGRYVPNHVNGIIDQWQHNLEFTFGAFFNFGGSTTQKPPKEAPAPATKPVSTAAPVVAPVETSTPVPTVTTVPTVAPAVEPAVTPSPKIIYFQLNRTKLTNEARATLDELVSSLKGSPGSKVEVGGHADTTGESGYNQQLSERRVQTVRKYLVRHGIAEERLVPMGFGPTKPANDNATLPGRRANRRVELTVRGP
ncbi:MAG: OmpA family protein [Pseudomonadota bacterium]